MKLSVLDLVPVIEGGTVAQALRDAAALAQTAERLGYHRYWVAEHHGMAGIASAAVAVTLAHIGQDVVHALLDDGIGVGRPMQSLRKSRFKTGVLRGQAQGLG